MTGVATGESQILFVERPAADAAGALGFRELSSDFREVRDRGSCPNYESNASDKNAPRNRLRNKVRRAGGVSAVDGCRVIGAR